MPIGPLGRRGLAQPMDDLSDLPSGPIGTPEPDRTRGRGKRQRGIRPAGRISRARRRRGIIVRGWLVFAALVVFFAPVVFFGATVVHATSGRPPLETGELLGSTVGLSLFLAAFFAPALAQRNWRIRALGMVVALWQAAFFLFFTAPVQANPVLEFLVHSRPAVIAGFGLTILVVKLGYLALNAELFETKSRSEQEAEDW